MRMVNLSRAPGFSIGSESRLGGWRDCWNGGTDVSEFEWDTDPDHDNYFTELDAVETAVRVAAALGRELHLCGIARLRGTRREPGLAGPSLPRRRAWPRRSSRRSRFSPAVTADDPLLGGLTASWRYRWPQMPRKATGNGSGVLALGAAFTSP